MWQPRFWTYCWHFKSAIGTHRYFLINEVWNKAVSCGWQNWANRRKICGWCKINKIIMEIRNKKLSNFLPTWFMLWKARQSSKLIHTSPSLVSFCVSRDKCHYIFSCDSNDYGVFGHTNVIGLSFLYSFIHPSTHLLKDFGLKILLNSILTAPKSLQMVIAAMKLKDAYSLEGNLWPN